MTKKEAAISTFIIGAYCIALPVCIGAVMGISDAYNNGVANDGPELALTGAVEIFKENAALASGIAGCALLYIGSRLNR